MLGRTVRERIMARSSLAPIRVPAFDIISAMQRQQDPSIQLDALALTFSIVCLGADIDPHDLVTRAKRQIADAERIDNPILEAIRDYAAGELK